MTAKEERFCFVLSKEEREQLEALASAEGRSAANWLRAIIAHEHLVSQREKRGNDARYRKVSAAFEKLTEKSKKRKPTR